MMTREEAIKQLQEKLSQPGKLSITKVTNALLGVATDNKADLQAMLDKLLNQQGAVISADDQKAVQSMVDKQKEERKVRAKIVVRNVAVGILTAAGIVGVYYTVRHRGKIK